MPKIKSSDLARARRRTQVIQLYLKGWPQTTIAEHLGIGQATVSRDINATHDEWVRSRIQDMDRLKAIELANNNELKREAWAGWERSQQPAESTKVTSDGTDKKAEKIVQNRDGDPRFLEVIHKCGIARRDMLGLDAPKRIAPTTPDGQPLSPEQRKTHIMAIIVEQLGDIQTVNTEEIIDEPRIPDVRTIDAGASEPQRRAVDPSEPAASDGEDAA